MPVRRASAPRPARDDPPRTLRLTVLAARNELLLCSFLQLCVGVGLAVQLLVGRDLITDVFGNERGLELGDLAPMLVALAIASGVVAGATVALGERQRILAALVERHIQDRIIDVVVEVPIESFENPVFHDRLRRASQNASERSFQVSIAIVSLLSAVLTSIPIGLVLLRLHPLVLPAVVVAYLPLHLATSRNGRAAYDFNHWMTTSDRERAYLGGLLLAPQPAKEVRLFGSAPWIRRRYDELYDRRILELRRLTRRRLNRSLIATAWSTAVTIGGLAVLIQWSISGRLSAAEAGVAAIAVQQIGSRMRTFGGSSGDAARSAACSWTTRSRSWRRRSRPPVTRCPSRRRTSSSCGPRGYAFTYPGSDREVLHEITIELRRRRGRRARRRERLGQDHAHRSSSCRLYQPVERSHRLGRASTLARCGSPTRCRAHITAALPGLHPLHAQRLATTSRLGRPQRSRRPRRDPRGGRVGRRRRPDRSPSCARGYETTARAASSPRASRTCRSEQWQRLALARSVLPRRPFLDPRTSPPRLSTPRRSTELFEADA